MRISRKQKKRLKKEWFKARIQRISLKYLPPSNHNGFMRQYLKAVRSIGTFFFFTHPNGYPQRLWFGSPRCVR